MNLYRRTIFLASLSLLAVSSIAILAQRRATHKLRATALLEITTDSTGVVKSHVVPIAILDEGHFHDAGIYKATPRPMALADGVVYEAQQSGKAVGYVTITTGANQGGWIALGKWTLPSVAKKAEQQPAAPADERPVLHHGDSTPAASATPTPEQPSAGSAPPPQDPDRPVLRKAPEKAQPEQSAAATSTPTPGGAVSAPAAPPVEPGTKIYVGVSDAESGDTRSYEYPWKPGEEQKMQNRMIKIALGELPHENAQLTPNSLKNIVMRSFDLDMSNEAVLVLSAEVPGSYLAPGAKQTPDAKKSTGAKRPPRAKQTYEAKQAPAAKEVPDANEVPGKFVSRYVTVIARVDFEGIPRKLASSVTDSTRLDVAPRLELIDAVDVDGDGLAELLFREYSFDEKSFIIYGVGRNAVTKVFEGASTKLK